MPSAQDLISLKRMAAPGPRLPVPRPPKRELPPAVYARFPGLREAEEKNNQALADWATKQLTIVNRSGA